MRGNGKDISPGELVILDPDDLLPHERKAGQILCWTPAGWWSAHPERSEKSSRFVRSRGELRTIEVPLRSVGLVIDDMQSDMLSTYYQGVFLVQFSIGLAVVYDKHLSGL